MEHRVGRQRPARVDALGAQLLDRGRDHAAILVAERAFLAGVRVEPGEREPRPRDAEALAQVARDDPAGFDDQVAW